MLLKISNKAEKKRRLKAENESPKLSNLPVGYGKPHKKLTAKEVTKNYEQNIFRASVDWKPGRVTKSYRDRYDQIEWD